MTSQGTTILTVGGVGRAGTADTVDGVAISAITHLKVNIFGILKLYWNFKLVIFVNKHAKIFMVLKYLNYNFCMNFVPFERLPN